MIRTALALLMLVGAVQFATAADSPASAPKSSTPRPQGKNCSLSAPPPSAGEIFTNAASWSVYPRTADIKPDYVGCQAVWAPAGHGRWELATLLVVRHAAAVAIWPEPPDSEADHCKYRQGRVVEGSAPACSRLIVSVPAGCARRALAQGSYPVYPKGCDEDDPALRADNNLPARP